MLKLLEPLNFLGWLSVEQGALNGCVCAMTVSGSVGKGNIQPHLHNTSRMYQLNIE